MIPVKDFLSKVEEISERSLTYRTGGSGNDGTCDCIGLIMGAMNELGYPKYDMHSTNYFARHQMEMLEPVELTDIRTGMILYKARESTAQLNGRYQPGGRYYTGDMLDYYHVGVVESVSPLMIVHCTESGNIDGITRDYKIGSWTHAGKLKGVDYDVQEEEAVVSIYKAIVTAPSGKTVNLRSRPSMGGLLYMRVPVGAKVTVLETARNDADEQWSRVEFNGMAGYMKTDFLFQQDDHADSSVVLRISCDAAEELRRALSEVSAG